MELLLAWHRSTETSQDLLKIIALINGDTRSSACDVHVQKFLNIFEISVVMNKCTLYENLI